MKPSSAEFPFVTHDYHLIVSSEEFLQYQEKAKKRKWILIGAAVSFLVLIISIAGSVIPVFLKAHLDISDSHTAEEVSHDTHSIAVPFFTPSLLQMKATYGE